jgi:hypothetical protein
VFGVIVRILLNEQQKAWSCEIPFEELLARELRRGDFPGAGDLAYKFNSNLVFNIVLCENRK